MRDYGIYSTDGKKLSNSDEILAEKDRFWGNLTKKVFDRIPNNVFGILLQPLWLYGELHWIVRESKKWDLKTANLWCKKLFKCNYE